MHRALILCLLTATPALAEQPLSAEAFDALSLGRTMTWAELGIVYGMEQYLPGRRVRWTMQGETCMTGHWYPDGDAICFKYETLDDPACWTLLQEGGQVTAFDTDNPPGTSPVTIAETDEPMACFGPDVGA